MFSSQYAPLCDKDTGAPIQASSILQHAQFLEDGVLAVDLMDDHKIVFIPASYMLALRENGRLRP